jgi:hypothetical protein
MSTRYLTNIALALVAGFLVVASQAFTASAYAWLSFAGGVAIGAVALCGLALRGRGGVQRAIDAAVVVLGAWTVVSSLVFATGSVIWLGFSAAVAVLALAITGLTANELGAEQVVHSLQVNAQTENANDGRAVAHA